MTTISTHHRALIAVFASEGEAMRAHSALLRSGIDPKDVAISADLTRDGIAAEAPGQAYENQGSAQDLWQLFTRPTRRVYATPVAGLYLCSSSTPPGGGVHGLCGYFAARAALRALH